MKRLIRAGWGGKGLILAALGLALATGLAWSPRSRPHRALPVVSAAQPEGPPSDPRYQAALRRGRSGELRAARKDLLRLATTTRDPNTGAWALHQAALAARASGDPGGHRELTGRLRREYPEHSLALRAVERAAGHSGVQEFRHSGTVAKPSRASSDCGPKALAWMLRRAGKPVDLARLTRECGTDAQGTTLLALRDTARKHGLPAEGAQVNADFLRREQPRGLAWVNGVHYVAFEPAVEAGRVRVWDPNDKTPSEQDWEQLVDRSQGVVLLVAWGGTRLPKL